MIVLSRLSKVFEINGTRRVVADRIDAVFPPGVSVGLLGRNGAGKSTLLRVIAGTSAPTGGRVTCHGSVSYPVGLATSLHPDMTGAQNTRFVARIYGAETAAMARFVAEFAELGDQFDLPVRTYSSGMKSRLSFGINMALPFDTYLVDEITAAGDAAFREKSRHLFLARMRTAGAIFVSHSTATLREFCTAGAVLEGGRLNYYHRIDDAIAHHEANLRRAPRAAAG